MYACLSERWTACRRAGVIPGPKRQRNGMSCQATLLISKTGRRRTTKAIESRLKYLSMADPFAEKEDQGRNPEKGWIAVFRARINVMK